MRPICPSAEIVRKTSYLQNFTELLSYSQRTIFSMAALRQIEFKKFSYLITWLSSSFKSAVVYQISSNSNDFSLIYGDITIFKDGGRTPSWICEIYSLCHVTSIAMLLCFPVQNFTEIGQSAAELWPKNDFQYGGCPPSWISKIFTFSHVTVTEFQICCSVLNFIKIGWFRWDMAIWQFSKWPMSAILNFRGLRMGSLKSSCSTSYW